jgi:hypothetical protein
MSDDLVERLDRKAQYTDRYFDNASLGEMYREAAAEIRSLREQVAQERADREQAILAGMEIMREAAAREGERGRNYWRDKCNATKARRESRDYETMAIACVHVEHAIHALDPAAILAEHTRLTNLIPPDRKIDTRGTVGDSDGDDGA